MYAELNNKVRKEIYAVGKISKFVTERHSYVLLIGGFENNGGGWFESSFNNIFIILYEILSTSLSIKDIEEINNVY